jgi:plastocyanin domain-containing protein
MVAKILVTITGFALIVLINWYFLGKKKRKISK